LAKLIEYDVTDVEESQGGTGVKIKPGVHPARIVRATHRTQRKDGQPANDIEIALDVGAEYDWLFTYVGLNPESEWKLAELVRAVGLKEKGKIDPEKHLKDKVIRVKVNPDTYGDQPTVSAGRLMKAQPGDEDKIGESVSELSSQETGPEDEPAATTEYPAGPDFEPSREGEEGVGSYDDWDEADLSAEAEDRGLTLPGGRGSKKNKAIQALRDEDAEASGANAGEPEASANGVPDDYDEWDLDRLKQEWEERQMGDLPAIKGRGAADRMKAALIDEIRKDDVENPFDA
jgi:hypothetical protein